jgi:hypothetical protein
MRIGAAIGLQTKGARPLNQRTCRHQVAQQIQDADKDDDDADDLLRPPVDRKEIDEIKNKNNDQKCNQNAYQKAHLPDSRDGGGSRTEAAAPAALTRKRPLLFNGKCCG